MTIVNSSGGVQNILRTPRDSDNPDSVPPEALEFIAIPTGPSVISKDDWAIVQNDPWGSHLIEEQMLSVSQEDPAPRSKS